VDFTGLCCGFHCTIVAGRYAAEARLAKWNACAAFTMENELGRDYFRAYRKAQPLGRPPSYGF